MFREPYSADQRVEQTLIRLLFYAFFDTSIVHFVLLVSSNFLLFFCRSILIFLVTKTSVVEIDILGQISIPIEKIDLIRLTNRHRFALMLQVVHNLRHHRFLLDVDLVGDDRK
jgi:hypothetical protein